MIKALEDAENIEDVFVIPDDHLSGIVEGLAQIERGEFASDEEVAALWKKYGL